MKKPLKIILGVLLALVLAVSATFIPALSPKTLAMKEYRSGGFRVYAETENRPDFDELTLLIGNARAEIQAALPEAGTGGIDIIVYPSNRSLHVQTYGLIAGPLLPEWYIGNNTRRFVLITSPSNPGRAHERASIIKAAVHEYVHVLTDRINARPDKWIKEGIAVYLSGQPFRVNLNRAVSFADFDSQDPWRFGDVGGYNLSGNAIMYLKERYGWDKVTELLKNGGDYEKALGTAKRDFFEEWKLSLWNNQP